MEMPFYRQGLRFECKQCSACCRGEPGFVFLQEADIQALCAELNLEREAFLSAYCKVVDFGLERLYSLKEKPNNDCVLWEGGCRVYKSRPVQCRTYPFWASILASQESWQQEATYCPGIGAGKLYTQEEIEARLIERRKSRQIGPDTRD